MNSQFDSPAYRRSRAAYCAQCTFEYFIAILVSDAYLAKLLSSIGFSDALTGVVSSFISAAFLFQLFSVFFVQKIKNIKRTAIFFHMLGSVLFVSLYLIPFLPVPSSVQIPLVILCLLLAYFGNYFVSSIIFKWANSYVDPQKRASYSAGKEMISLLTGMIFTLAVGFIIDHFESLDRLESGFLFIACAGLILSLCSFLSLLLIEKPRTEASETAPAVPIRTVLKNTLGNKNFLNVIILTILWDMSRYMTIGFLGTFKTSDLLLTVGFVQVINIMGSLFRFFLSKPFGRYSDKTSYAHGMKIAICIAAAGFLINCFTTRNTWWCIILYTILYNVSLSGTNQNSFNIVYSYVDADYFVQATAIKNSIGGIFGFVASLIGSRILAAVQASGNTVLGIPMYGQQLLSFLSFLLAVAAILFVHFVIEKQEVMKQ